MEGPVDDDGRHVDVYAAQQAPATMQDQDGVGKLLRRAQATVVEAAQVHWRLNFFFIAHFYVLA